MKQKTIIMKKILTNTVNKMILLILFVAMNISAFAADGNSEATGNRWQVVSSMPQFWIGLAVFFAFLGLAIFSGKKKNEHAV